MEWMLFAKGLLAGFVICFASMTSDLYTANYVLTRNWAAGAIAALGITTVQIVWATLGIFALRLSLRAIEEHLRLFILFGACILLVMAFRLYRRERRRQKQIPQKPTRFPFIYLEAILFALSAPGKIALFSALFLTTRVERYDPNFSARIPLLVGVALGSLAWWALYLFVINQRRERISQTFVSRLQKVAAVILVCFALYGIYTALFR